MFLIQFFSRKFCAVISCSLCAPLFPLCVQHDVESLRVSSFCSTLTIQAPSGLFALCGNILKKIIKIKKDFGDGQFLELIFSGLKNFIFLNFTGFFNFKIVSKSF